MLSSLGCHNIRQSSLLGTCLIARARNGIVQTTFAQSQINARNKSDTPLLIQRIQSPVQSDFWGKNKQLSRPISPHMSVYRPQMTWVLSLLHRATGIGASAVLYAGGIGALFCTSQSFPEIVQLIQDNVPHFMLLTVKTALGGSIIYHTLNGVRHLIWDVGYGFQLKHLYMSGYVVLAVTAIGTAMIFIRG